MTDEIVKGRNSEMKDDEIVKRDRNSFTMKAVKVRQTTDRCVELDRSLDQ